MPDAHAEEAGMPQLPDAHGMSYDSDAPDTAAANVENFFMWDFE